MQRKFYKAASAVEQRLQTERTKGETPMDALKVALNPDLIGVGTLSDSRSQTGEREEKPNAFGHTRTQRISWKTVWV